MKRRAISPAALPAIGQPFAGGFYVGRLFFDGAEHAVVDAGRDFETLAHWWDQEGPRPRIRGATSRFDGLANTQAMAAEGSKIAQQVLGLNVRGHWGWHIPSIEELQLMRMNLLQIEDWDHRMAGSPQAAAQSFRHSEYWSSSQKENAATAWCMVMLPWCVPDTNWVSQRKGIRPVRTFRLKADAFVHEPASDAPAVSPFDLAGLADSKGVAEVLGRFVNEDTGRFYGRADALVAELAALAGGPVETGFHDAQELTRQE